MTTKEEIQLLINELEIQKDKLEKLKFYVFWLESQIKLEEIKNITKEETQ